MKRDYPYLFHSDDSVIDNPREREAAKALNGTGLLGHFALALKWIHYHMLEIGGFHLDSFLGNSALMPFNGLLSFPSHIA